MSECPDNPCWCANNTEYLEDNLRMVEQPFEVKEK